MRPIVEFVKTTVLGGVFFLLPLVVLVAVVGKAVAIARPLVEPIQRLVALGSIGGIGAVTLLASAAVLLLCFVAGLTARSRAGIRTIDWVESNLLSHLPFYALLKGIGQGMAGLETGGGREPVLALGDVGWQVGFVIEPVGDDLVAVFLPDAPSPWSGSVCFMTRDRIRPIRAPRGMVLQCLRRLGAGSQAMVRDTLSDMR